MSHGSLLSDPTNNRLHSLWHGPLLSDATNRLHSLWHGPLLSDATNRLHSLWHGPLLSDATNNRLHSLWYRHAAKETCTDPSAVKQLAHSMFEVESEIDARSFHSVDIDVEICSCHVDLTGCWCKHQAVVAAKFNLATNNQVPRCSPELRHLLYSVATGNPTAVDQSFFVCLNEEDERKVLGIDKGDARRVAGDSVMDDVTDQKELVLIRLINYGTPTYFTVVLLDMDIQLLVT